VAVWAATARVILVVMTPWISTVVAVSPPLLRPHGGDDTTGVEELDVMEPNGEEPCVDEPCSQRGLAGSSE
jgi:hypothetical protein